MSGIEFGKRGLKPSSESLKDEKLQNYKPLEILGILHGQNKLPELDRWTEI